MWRVKVFCLVREKSFDLHGFLLPGGGVCILDLRGFLHTLDFLLLFCTWNFGWSLGLLF